MQRCCIGNVLAATDAAAVRGLEWLLLRKSSIQKGKANSAGTDNSDAMETTKFKLPIGTCQKCYLKYTSCYASQT